MEQELGKKLLARIQTHEGERQVLSNIFDDIAFYCAPGDTEMRSLKVKDEDPGSNTPVTATGIHAAITFASGMYGNVYSPGEPWFEIVPGGKYKDNSGAKDACRIATEKALEHVTDSNLSQTLYTAILRWGVFGTAIEYVELRPDKRLSFQSHDVRDCFIEEDDGGQADAVFRVFKMSARQAAQRWGDSIPDALKEQAKDVARAAAQHDFVHCVFARADFSDLPGTPADKKRWASVYIWKRDGHICGPVGGYDSFPFAVGRFLQVDGTAYGRGLGYVTLPGLRTLNAMTKDFMDAIEYQIGPPMFLPTGVDPEKVDMRPRAVNNFLHHNTPPPVFVRPEVDIGAVAALLERTEGVVENHWFVPLFRAISQMTHSNRMTQLEVQERQGEGYMMLTPIASRLMTELIEPLLSRAIALLAANNLITLPQGAQVVLRSRLQSRLLDVDTNRINQAVSTCAMLAQAMAAAQDMELLAVFDKAAMYRKVAENMRVSSGVVRTAPVAKRVLDAVQKREHALRAAAMTQQAIKPLDATKAPEVGSLLEQR